MNVNDQSGQNAFAAQVFNQIMPPGGMVKAMPVKFELTGGVEQTLNLEGPISRKIIDQVQSVFIGNRNNDVAFVIVSKNTFQVISAPARSQGWYPILAGNPPVFEASASEAINVDCIFVNVPMPVGNWNADTSESKGGSNGVTCTSVSQNVGGNLLVLPANPNRKYLLVTCNTAAIGLNFVLNDASPGTPGTVDMIATEKWESGPSVPTGEVYVFGTGALVTIIEGV